MKHRKNLPLPASLSSCSSVPRAPISYSEYKLNSSISIAPDGAVDTTPPSAPALVPEYFELLARSCFSFLQGASQPDEMVQQAQALDYSGIAICDVNGMYGIVRGFQAAERPSAFDAAQFSAHRPAKFQYAFGVELSLSDASPVTLLPMTKDGYVSLSRLITNAKRKAPKGQIQVTLGDVLELSHDIIAMALPPWRDEELTQLHSAFHDRLYLPVMRDFTWQSTLHYQEALRIEQAHGIALFATQRPLFHEPSRKPLHDILTCVAHGTTVQEAETKLLLNRERYLKSREQIADLYRDRPDMIARTLEIAQRLQFSLTELRYHYPREYLPPGRSASEFLLSLVDDGLAWRYRDKPDLRERARAQADRELALILELEYEDYFLTLWDICQFARERKILHQGRGSAANSVVCFALGLTSADPIQFSLLFERFISRERNEPPDIDIDFEHERREEVIQYIYRKYGERHAAMVCTVICYRSRMAVREVAKAMGLPLAHINALIKHMGREGLRSFSEAGSREILRAKLAGFDLDEDRFDKIIRLAVALQGFPRHLGIHSGGFVISHDPIVDIVPVESATKDGRYVIQWNKDDINTLGLMKIDVLSLGMLTAIRKALTMLRDHKGIDWNLAQVPADDTATFDMICKADTVGVFQIESRAQMSLLPRLKPRTFYDLVVEVAIVRPGPIQGGMVHPYLRRRAGQEKIVYADQRLVPILQKTFGIPLFQEQVMQIVVAVAGFTAGEADELRRLMSSAWRKPRIMQGLHQRVVNGMLNNGLKREYAEQIYKTIEGFASYGFPESHAISFALLTSVSCYLKFHHPDVFACALLNSQPMGFYSPRQLIADAQRHGVVFEPLDVNHSSWHYTLTSAASRAHSDNATHAHVHTSTAAQQRAAVRTGFCSIHGVREQHIEALIRAREQGGAYCDINDFIKRSGLPKAAALRLGAAGAFETLGLSARESLWTLQAMSFDSHALDFSEPVGLNRDRQLSEADEVPQEDAWTRTQREYATKGFSLDSHPMAILRPQLEARTPKILRACDLPTVKNRTRLRVAGLLSLIQKPPTAKGMCFLSLDDETGIMNIVITPDLYRQCRTTLMTSPLLEIDGVLESYSGVYNIRAHSIHDLCRAPSTDG